MLDNILIICLIIISLFRFHIFPFDLFFLQVIFCLQFLHFFPYSNSFPYSSKLIKESKIMFKLNYNKQITIFENIQ